MRNLFALFALIGVAGIVLGVLNVLRQPYGQHGPLPFTYEYTGGPGSIIAGFALLAAGLYLRAAWQGRD